MLYCEGERFICTKCDRIKERNENVGGKCNSCEYKKGT